MEKVENVDRTHLVLASGQLVPQKAQSFRRHNSSLSTSLKQLKDLRFCLQNPEFLNGLSSNDV